MLSYTQNQPEIKYINSDLYGWCAIKWDKELPESVRGTRHPTVWAAINAIREAKQ